MPMTCVEEYSRSRAAARRSRARSLMEIRRSSGIVETSCSYWNSRPHLAVVGAHEHVRDPGAERAMDPFAKVPGRRTGLGGGRRRRLEAAKTGAPLRLGQTVKIELERVRHEAAGHPDPRLAIVI